MKKDMPHDPFSPEEINGASNYDISHLCGYFLSRKGCEMPEPSDTEGLFGLLGISAEELAGLIRGNDDENA